MLVKDLLKRLTQLVNINPNNAFLEVKWYDHFRHELCKAAEGLPIRLFENIYTGFKYCILNATTNPPAYGLKAISDKNGNSKEEPETNNESNDEKIKDTEIK